MNAIKGRRWRGGRLECLWKGKLHAEVKPDLKKQLQRRYRIDCGATFHERTKCFGGKRCAPEEVKDMTAWPLDNSTEQLRESQSASFGCVKTGIDWCGGFFSFGWLQLITLNKRRSCRLNCNKG